MRALLIVALLGAGTAAAHAAGSEYSCARGGTIRTVSVVAPESSARCEVQYDKATGTAQVLWHADDNSAYCESQAKTLVEKLTSAGWECSGTGVTAATSALPEPFAVAVPPMDGAPSDASNGISSDGVTGATPPAPLIDPSIKLRGTIH